MYVYFVCVLCLWFVCVSMLCIFVCAVMSESCLWFDVICVCVWECGTCGGCVCYVICVIFEHVMCIVHGVHVLYMMFLVCVCVDFLCSIF